MATSLLLWQTNKVATSTVTSVAMSNKHGSCQYGDIGDAMTNNNKLLKDNVCAITTNESMTGIPIWWHHSYDHNWRNCETNAYTATVTVENFVQTYVFLSFFNEK